MVTRKRLVLFLFFSLAVGQPTYLAAQLTPQARNHFEVAQEAQTRGNYVVAEREYREVIALSPHFAEAYMNLGLAFQLQRQIPEAMKMFERALKIKPTLTGANFILGMDYCQRGEGGRAVPLLRAAVRTKPERPEIWVWLATAEGMTGNLPEAVRTLLEGLRLHPNNLDMLYVLGHTYEALGRQAIDQLKKLHGNSSYVDQLLAEDYMTSGYLSSALLHLQRALRISPNRPDLYVLTAEVFLRAGRLKQAAREIQKALALDPHDLQAWVLRGEVRLFGGDIDGGLTDWSRAIMTDAPRTKALLGVQPKAIVGLNLEPLPSSLKTEISGLQAQLEKRNGESARLAMAYLELHAAEPDSIGSGSSIGFERTPQSPALAACNSQHFQQWLKEGNLDAATRCGSKVLTLGSPAALRLQFARACFLTNRSSEALKILNALPWSVRNSPPALYWRVRAYKELAFDAYKKLYRLSPDSYRVHELQGDIYQAQGLNRKAIEEYQKVLKERPDLPNLHYEVGHLLWENLQVKPALQELRAELALNPRHAGALLDIGTVYLFEQQPRKALPYLFKAAVIDPKDPDIPHYLGMAYLRTGNYRQAEAELKKVVSQDQTGQIHYLLAQVYRALGERQDAAHEFAISADLSRKADNKNVERVQRLNKASALLKQP